MAAKDSPVLKPTRLVTLEAVDVRFPTSLVADGSDAVHTDPDYSAAYVRLITDVKGVEGCGLSFTIGRGNELVVSAIESLKFLVMGRFIEDIQGNMACWVHDLNHESQLRWVGPEKGVIALATAAIINAFWDLWGKLEGKPVWKLLVDMSPDKLISLIDFKYIEDLLTPTEALNILQRGEKHRPKREKEMILYGFPAYTTQVGWLGYSDGKIHDLCQQFLEDGFTAFKVKVGANLKDDKRRLSLIRKCIGPYCDLMVDANQKWSVNEATEWMKELKDFNIKWIEEPTSPDDVMGHATIAKALKHYDIGVATGEMCQNRVMFKQFLSANAMAYCQIDSARMGGGLNEVLAVYLMAHKKGVPVCPHAGGVGLCEMVQHLQVFDYVCLSGSTKNRMIEYVGHLHEHFAYPPKLGRAKYFPPSDPGYSTEITEKAILDYEYPDGIIWKLLMAEGRYRDPSLDHKRMVINTALLSG